MVNREAILKVKAAIKRSADFDYFFDSLKSEAWILPLFEEGFFNDPYAPIQDEKYIRFPVWPASRYLIRMAESSPKAVADVALRIPETSNVRIWEDLAEIALKLPPTLAVKFVPLAKRWLQSSHHLLLPEKLGQLISHLAKGEQVAAALDLAKHLIVVLPDPASQEVTTDDEIETFRPSRPRSQFEEWEYQRILARNIPDLITVSWRDTLTWLCDLLDESILSLSPDSKKGPEDFSYIWRRAIEDHSQNISDELKDLLVTAVRDATLQVAASQPQRVREVIEVLEARKWKVFSRVALHVMRLHPESVLDVITERLTDRDRFEDAVHEYRLLLQAMWTRIGLEAQNTILGWIDGGPADIEERSRYWERERGEQPSAEQKEQYKKNWQLKKLALIHMNLDQTWQARYQTLTQELGEPDHPEFSVYMTTSWTGPHSPRDKTELETLSVPDLRQFLSNWQPQKDWRGAAPTPEGLGRILTTVVSEQPEKYASGALEFRGLDPTYARSVIEGFGQAIGHGRSFPWQPVLTLCRWVIEQPISLPGRVVSDRDADPNWEWARKSITRFLSSGFTHETLNPPLGLRETIWEILQPLTHDQDPTPEDEAASEGNKWEPTTLSINTTRGNALHAVIRYAIWVREHLDKSAGDSASSANNFESMPEVREVLDDHLDPQNDPSAAIRSVYGQWLPTLYYLDSSWVASQVKKIFPTEADAVRLHLAAWDAFIGFTSPNKELFQLLKDEYRAAVERIGADLPEQQLSDDRDERLAEHLMLLYWWGNLSLEVDQGLVARFYDKATPELSAKTMHFLGRCLRDNKELPEEAVDRLKGLWIWRFTQITTSDESQLYIKELSEFGGWFASEHLDPEWSIYQLLNVLQRTGKAEPDHLVIERLAEIRETMPGKALECLRLLIEGDQEGWLLLGQQANLRQILSSALTSADGHVSEAATNFINWLAAKGTRDFLTLLSQQSR